MNSTVELMVVSSSADSARAGARAVQQEVARLDSILSDFRTESNVGQINARRTDQVAPETRELLLRARQVCRETGGAFDVTIRPVKHLWGFGTGGTPHVPDSAAVREALRHVGCDTWDLDPDGRFVWHDALAEIDLGGIAQGYVAAKVAALLRGRGISSFLVNISGDVLASGRRPDGAPWRVGVQDPRRPDSLLARLDLDVAAVTTSGDYEQYFIADGVRYHHIFDPATGYPARDLASVSVLSDDPVAADCYATAVFVLGPERGLAFLNARPDLRGLLVSVTSEGKLVLRWSHGMEKVRR
jgi:thiamine biosynthesis lipoprotein